MKRVFSKVLLIICIGICNLQIVISQEDQDCKKLLDICKENQKNCLTASSSKFSSPFIIATFGIINHESEMGRLDLFAQRISENPKSTAYVVAYGGKVNKFGEFDIRTDRIKNYLLDKKKLDPTRIKFVHGGFRETFEFELWISPIENSFPPLTPRVSPERVKFRGKMTSIETCCETP
jgi:hypothetical protein